MPHHMQLLLHKLSRALEERARHTHRQWARLALMAAAFRADRKPDGLANRLQPGLPVITALAAL